MSKDRFGDWDRMDRLLNSREFVKRLRRHMRVGNRRVGHMLRKRILEAINARRYTPNSALTVAMKGSSLPLVDTGGLRRAIGFQTHPDGLGLDVGVKRSAGDKTINYAAALHEGFTLHVPPGSRIRKAVFAKLNERGKGRFTQRGPMRTVWVIPGRPFIRGPVEEALKTGEVQRWWQRAFFRALTEV